MKSNIFFGNKTGTVSSPSWTIQYNLFKNTRDAPNTTLDHTNIVGKDPAFIDPNGNFHLRLPSPQLPAGSPALNTGNPTAIYPGEVDLDGNPRIFNGKVDIGAYENQGGSSGGDTTPPSVPTNAVATAPHSTQAVVSWTASTDNVGVSGYQILRNGNVLGTTANTTNTDNTVSAGNSYSYTVKAYDPASQLLCRLYPGFYCRLTRSFLISLSPPAIYKSPFLGRPLPMPPATTSTALPPKTEPIPKSALPL